MAGRRSPRIRSGEHGLLVPVRVQPCEPPGLLASRVYVDLVDVDETQARERLLAAVGPVNRPRPTTAAYPGGAAAPDAAGGGSGFPGLGPAVSNLPARNRNFTGRGRGVGAAARRLQAGVGGGGAADRGGARPGWGRQDRSWRWSTRTGSAATTT